MKQSMRTAAILLACVVAGGVGRAQNSPPVAEDDVYATGAGDNLSVDEPGVLENDFDDDGDPLTAVLVDGPTSGGVANLFSDGSFEYEPPGGFTGTDTFTYQAYDGTDFSNIATVEVTVSGTAGTAGFLDEAAFLAALSALGYEATIESFEDDQVWGGVRSTVAGGNHTAPSIASLGVVWTGNNPASEITTSNGAARTGSWGVYELPHGSYTTGVDCHLPGRCTDGFVGRTSPVLYGVGGWVKGFFGSKVELTLDGSRVVDFGGDVFVDSAPRFIGVVDPAGFRSFEYHELEGTVDDAKYIWADDFTFATPPGITLSVSLGEGPGEVVLQWLGGQPGFAVYASGDPAAILDPGSELGQTPGRNWVVTPPNGGVRFFKVVPSP